jgi:N-(2-amino-2-carboxyethyl)-L-glutamate synthase
MIYQHAYDVVIDDVFLHLPHFGSRSDIEAFLKLEGLNPAGSVKLKTAVAMVEEAEHRGVLGERGRIIESSSGSLGVALASVCSSKRYDLTIVTDPNVNRTTLDAIQALGGKVVLVTTRDSNGGYLRSRIDYVVRAVATDPGLVWLNQYANPANIKIHHDRTARSIHAQFGGSVDVLVVGVGTAGTLMGCVDYFRKRSPRTRIVAVDAEGSVTFGGRPGPRRIPGLGSSQRPSLFRDHGGLEKVQVSERNSILMCRWMARRYGVLVGGSTGTVLAATYQLSATLPAHSRVVIVSPDLGERYLDTVFSDAWIQATYPGLSGADLPLEEWQHV